MAIEPYRKETVLDDRIRQALASLGLKAVGPYHIVDGLTVCRLSKVALEQGYAEEAVIDWAMIHRRSAAEFWVVVKRVEPRTIEFERRSATVEELLEGDSQIVYAVAAEQEPLAELGRLFHLLPTAMTHLVEMLVLLREHATEDYISWRLNTLHLRQEKASRAFGSIREGAEAGAFEYLSVGAESARFVRYADGMWTEYTLVNWRVERSGTLFVIKGHQNGVPVTIRSLHGTVPALLVSDEIKTIAELA